MNRPTQALASRYHAHQDEAIARADAAGTRTDRVVGKVWRGLLRLLRTHPSNPYTAQHHARALFTPLLPDTARPLGQSLRQLTRWTHRSTVRALGQSIPRAWLVQAGRRRLREDEGSPEEEPVADLLDLLFPAPSEDAITRLMGPRWYDDLRHATRLATPDTLAAIVGGGYAAGKTQAEIAKDLLPAVNGVRVSARRVARTEGLRIAHRVQMAAHEELGDLIAGYRMSAVLDVRTRKAHRDRHGRVWYKGDSIPMEAALQMEGPTLPDSWNCRCQLIPVLREP